MADEVRTPEAPKEQAKAPTVEELMAEITNLKKAISASNADASKRKKEAEDWQTKYKSTLDEQKRKELEADEELKRIKEENAAYRTKDRISSYQTKLMSAGYDETTAKAMATALPEGIEDSFFEGQKAFLANKIQEIKAEKINSQPNLPTGKTPTALDAEQAELAKILKAAGVLKE